ncbi:unnamed protein product, partial [Ectocarpus fasciculatus]
MIVIRTDWQHDHDRVHAHQRRPYGAHDHIICRCFRRLPSSSNEGRRLRYVRRARP